MSEGKTSINDFFKSRPAPGSGGGAGTGETSSRPAAASAAPEKPASGGFFVPASEIDREWEVGKHLVRIERAEDYRAEASGNESFKLRLVCLYGETGAGAGIDDYWPKAGKGLKKTHKGCKAVGLVDEGGNISVPGGAQQFVGRELWIEIERVEEKFRDKDGDEKTRQVNKIGFTSYWPKSALEAPKEGDPFAEGPIEATAPVPAATGEVVGVEPGAAPSF